MLSLAETSDIIDRRDIAQIKTHTGIQMQADQTNFPRRLSDDLRQILDHAAGREIAVSEIVEILHGRGLNVLAILFALPFCTPIPLPGLSTPFGVILAFLGLRIALRQQPWLPKRMLARRIPYHTLTRIVKAAQAVAVRLEKILHPRMRFFNRWASFTLLNGLVIVTSALFLTLPLPIPFTNTFPAWSIVLLAAGMMEDDGLVITIGYLVAGAGWTYLFWIWWFGKLGLTHLGF